MYHHIQDETSPAAMPYCHHICDGKIMEGKMKIYNRWRVSYGNTTMYLMVLCNCILQVCDGI